MITAYTTIIDGRAAEADIKAITASMMRWSQSTALLRPGTITPVDSIQQIETLANGWPEWGSRPWIIAGRIDRSNIALRYGGPFIKDCSGSGYDAQTIELMTNFDWAIFSYFTTYHGNFYTFVTKQREFHLRLLLTVPQKALFAIHEGAPPLMCKLNSATFYDYGEEGWLCHELARDLGETEPLILSSVNPDKIDSFRRWNQDTDSWAKDVWFEEPLTRLEQVDEFCLDREYGRILFKLHRAVDLDAYLSLWEMAGDSCAIADATLSSDSDINKLKGLLAEPEYFDITHLFGEVGSWIYGQIYGGGADEHHAVFHARDPVLTERIWQSAGNSAISRF